MRCPDLEDLIYWADIIDGAQFSDAKAAVELKEPAMRLMLVIEAQPQIRISSTGSFGDAAKTAGGSDRTPEIRATFERLYAHHLESIDIMRQAANCKDGVIEFDVSDHDLDGYNKFIPVLPVS